jgi:glucose/arabinose dehydrogenase
LLSLAVDPAVAISGHVFAIYTARGASGGRVFRLARFREVNGTLGERAVLVDDIPATSLRPRATIRFGADRKLYVALDDAGDARASGDWSAYNGKILRLNPDGTTPTDQLSPVYASGFRSPAGLDWPSPGGTPWVIDASTDGSEPVIVINNAQGYSIRPGIARHTLPWRAGAASMTFYRSGLIPAFRGDLLLASDTGQHVLRIRFSPTGERIIGTERLLEGQVGPVRSITVSPGGGIYMGTETALYRLIPE